jgi:Uma2 family endonuclease
MATEPSLWRFTVGDYHHMVEAGILCEDDRVELIDGEIIQMSPIGGQHVDCVSRLTDLLVEHRGADARVNIQSPVRLGAHEEPEPDAAVVRARDYGGELPSAADVLLLIEVADTSLSFDRTRKLPYMPGREYRKPGSSISRTKRSSATRTPWRARTGSPCAWAEGRRSSRWLFQDWC